MQFNRQKITDIKQKILINYKQFVYKTNVLQIEIATLMILKNPKIIGNAWPSKYWYISQWEKVNLTGCTHSFTCLQITIFFINFIPEILFIIQISCNHFSLTTILSGLGLIIMDIICIFLWILITKIDPSDRVQQKHLQAIKNEEYFEEKPGMKSCQYCQTYTSQNGGHCFICQRCVQFLHFHSKCFNNCIGGKNYFQYLGLVFMIWIKNINTLVMSVIRIQEDKAVLLFISSILAGIFCISLFALLVRQLITLMRNKQKMKDILQFRQKDCSYQQIKSIQTEKKQQNTCQIRLSPIIGRTKISQKIAKRFKKKVIRSCYPSPKGSS